MRKTLSVAAVTLVLATGTGMEAKAADVTAAMDINTAYVWRGLTFNDGIVFQPSIDIAKGGFGLNVWGNFDADDYDGALDSGEFSEVDLTASYSFDIGPVSTGVGIIEYLFPAGGESTTELFVTAGMDFGGGFSGGLELYYDVDQVEDFYATASVGYGVDISEQVALEVGALISYAGEDFAEIYAGGTDSGFFNYGLSAGVSYAVSEALSVGGSINVSDSLDDDALPDETVDTTVYGGVSIAYTF